MLESESLLTSSKQQRASFDPNSQAASPGDRPPLTSPSRSPFRRPGGACGSFSQAAGPSGRSRCREKGCIFPATRLSPGKCLPHYLEECEPALFLSCQPTMLLLDQAKFGLPDVEGDDWRARDRRRLAALREQFLEEVP
jgi:hypothetical protein